MPVSINTQPMIPRPERISSNMIHPDLLGDKCKAPNGGTGLYDSSRCRPPGSDLSQGPGKIERRVF